MNIPSPIPPSRESELTSVINRHLFDQPPGDLKTPEELRRWKIFRERYHDAQNLYEFGPWPLQVDFELKYLCNFGCAFCPQGNPASPQPKKNTSLTFDDFKQVIDEGKRYGLCSIKMNYINEPLLVKNLPEYIDYAKSNGVLNVYFATNGTLLTEEVARNLIKARASKIMVSLDAITPTTFKLMRNSDRLYEIEDNIKRLISIRNSMGLTYPLVRVNFVKTKLNIHEAELFALRWKDLADMVAFEDQVALPGVEGGVINQKPDDFRCSFPFKLVVVDSERNILPCCTFSGREMPIGNLSTHTIAEAWGSKNMERLRLIHKIGAIESEPICMHCIGKK